MNETSTATLMQHLQELRLRLLKSLLAIVLMTAVAYSFKEPLYQFLLRPLHDAYGDDSSRRLIYTGLTEAFMMYLKLSLWAGFILAIPILMAQVYGFVAPGLYGHEKKAFLPFLLAVPVLFTAGAAMAYYWVFPMAWTFFLSFEMHSSTQGLPIQLEARVSEYLGLVTQIILAFGLAFQLPLLLVLLAKAGITSAEGLRSKRKLALVLILAAAAVLTPPDVFSQIALAVPLYLLYELAILAATYVQPIPLDDTITE